MKPFFKPTISLLFSAFLVAGAGSAFADSSPLTEQQLKSKMCKLVSEFENFKGTASFAKWGFSQAGPYNSWLKEIEKCGVPALREAFIHF